MNFKGLRGRGQNDPLGFPDTKHMDEEINNTNSYGKNEKEFSISCEKLEPIQNTWVIVFGFLCKRSTIKC